jgi:hypothetical protein
VWQARFRWAGYVAVRLGVASKERREAGEDGRGQARQAFKPEEIEMEMERKYLTQIAKQSGSVLMVDQVIELAAG